MTARTWLLALGAASALACSGEPGARPPGPTRRDAPVTAARCDALRPTVRALYEKEGKPSAGAQDPALTAEILGDNVHMVLTDCKTDPARFVPCIEAAASVAELEQSCVVPLDEEGTVEGRAFGGSR